MSSIELQLALEQKMVDSGAAAYMRGQRNAEKDGRGAGLDYSQRLMQEFVMPLSEDLKTWVLDCPKQASILGRARSLLRLIQPEKAVFIALRCLFNSFTIERSVTALASSIGKMIEDEIRFLRFAQLFGNYYKEIIDDFKRKNTKDYRHMQRVLTHKANEKQDQWTPWTPAEKVDVGMRLLDLILEGTDLVHKVERFYRGRPVVELAPTSEASEWIKEHEHVKQFMYPERAPCIIPPDPWVDIKQGGYYSPVMRQNVSMIKTNLPYNELKKHDLTKVMASINKVQSVAWQVNKEVLEIAKQCWKQNLAIGMPHSEKLVPVQCPVHGIKVEDMNEEQTSIFKEWKFEANAVYTAERERVSKTFQVTRIIRLASDYALYDAFWYVWYADFRGRLYTATAGFSPQGPDLAKGLIRFERGKALGARGLYWLKVHLANRFGYDKVSYDDRVAWVDERHETFLRAGADPLSHREVWAGADKPWQFLAALLEYSEAHALANAGVSPTEYVSHLPIGLDGSCNGLQNFSAMLRDAVGGAATNLVPQNKPADIYATVAEVTTRKLCARKQFLQTTSITANGTAEEKAEMEKDLELYDQWLTFGVDRKLCKRPVMTLPYGSTRQSAQQYLFQEVLARNSLHFGKGRSFRAATWLTPYVWNSIGEVVVAASAAMSWLQKCATAMNRINKPLLWVTADGFPAYQKQTVIETVQIQTTLQGRFQARVGTITDELDHVKQRLGIAPNFVHSMDATHLRMTVLAAVTAGIDDLCLIHDDYGTHACDTDLLHRAIRETFVYLYGEFDPLQDFADQLIKEGAAIPVQPARGTLDIQKVLESDYFFG